MAGNKRKPERYLYMLPDEFLTFIEAAYKVDLLQGILFDLCGNAGLRISEALELRPEHLNYVNNAISVMTLKQKEHKGERVEIYMPEIVMEHARKIIEGKKIKKGSRIFPFTRESAWRYFKVILGKAGLDSRYSPHALRHCAGIMAAELFEGDMMRVARRLRHSNPNHAYRYFHLLEEDQKKMAEYLNKFRKGKEDGKTDNE